MSNNTNINDNCYAQFINNLNKIKKLANESYVKDQIQKMIDALDDISNLNTSKRCDNLRQIISKLQNMINQQKGIWFRLNDNLPYESGFVKKIELKHRLRNISKIIIKLDDVVDAMYNTLHKELKLVGRIY